jgi:hypothetical protein
MSDPNHFWVFYAYNTNQGYLQAAAPQYWKPSTINRDQILTRPGDLQTGPIISSRDGIRITPDRIGDSVVRPLPREVYEPPLLANQLGVLVRLSKEYGDLIPYNGATITPMPSPSWVRPFLNLCPAALAMTEKQAAAIPDMAG